MALETCKLDLDGLFVDVLDVRDRFRTAEHLSGLRQARHELLGEQRQLNPFLPEGPLGFTAKTGHAFRQVGLKADAALLPVVGDAHAGPALLLHHVGDPVVDQLVEFGLIDLFAGFIGNQQVIKLGTARQAAGMGS